VIFAFGGCALMATSYWVVQRTCQVPLFAPKLAPSPSGAGRR
jgi:cytochrome c oxidase cbb3-type subunit 1